MNLSADRENESMQERWRKSVVVSHSRGSITEGTPLDLSGYGRPGNGKDIPTSEAQYVLSQRLGNIGSVVDKSLPLDLSGPPNNVHMPWSENNSPSSRPSSVQSTASLGNLSNVLERPPTTIDLSRLQQSTLSGSNSSRPWPFPRSASYVPPPTKTMTNPFLALSMHTARANKRVKEKSVETPSSKTVKDVTSSVPPTLNIPAGVAAASTISRPPTSLQPRTTPNSSSLPTTELTRAPPGLLNLGVSPKRVINYQGGTISIQPQDSHPPVASRTVQFSGGEPKTPEPYPEIHIKQEPVDPMEPTPCTYPSNGGMDEQHHNRMSPARSPVPVRSPAPARSPARSPAPARSPRRSSSADESWVPKSRTPNAVSSSRSPSRAPSRESVHENDRRDPEEQPGEKQPLQPPVVIKQEVTSAN